MKAQRILVIDPFLPMHDRASGSLRLNRILKMLVADGHEVTFVARNGWDPNGYADDLRSIGITVHAGDPARLRALGVEAPGDIDLENILRRGHFDTAILCFFELATQYLPLVRRHAPNTRVLIDTVDIHFLRLQRGAALAGDATLAAEAARVRAAELDVYSKVDGLIAVSVDERDRLAAELPGTDVFTITNVHTMPPLPPIDFGQRMGLLFVGNFAHTPNGEGILWFCEKVLPLVRRQLPSVTVDVVGQAPPAELGAYGASGVRVHGWVPSTEPYLMAARLSIAPLLHGAGQKGKVGEALSYGLPVVSTTIGAEGMGLTDGHDIAVADDPEAFAAAVVELYDDADRWRRQAAAGRLLIARTLTPQAVRHLVREVVPPSEGAAAHFLLAPDWDDVHASAPAVERYCRDHDGSTTSRLEILIVDQAVTLETAFAALVDTLQTAGLDPETVPDITITPIDSSLLHNLPADATWLPAGTKVEAPL